MKFFNKLFNKLFDKRNFSTTFLILGIIMFLHAAFMVMLICWGFFTSIKANSGTFNLFRNNEFGLPQGFPWQWEWSNYTVIFKYIYVDVYTNTTRERINAIGMLFNTLLYAFGGAAVATIVPLFTAYATSKIDYKFNVFMDTTVIVCMAIPIIGSQPSMLQVLSVLRLYDTWIGYFVMTGHFLGMYYLIFQAACRAVPISFSEAAEIEGAGYYATMFRIVLPLVKTIFLTVFLMQFIGHWNEYMTPLIYLKSHPTLAYGIFYLVFINGENKIANAPMKMAGSFILFVPMLILFILFRDILTQNLTVGGVKE